MEHSRRKGKRVAIADAEPEASGGIGVHSAGQRRAVAEVWDAEIVPMLEGAPDLRPVAVFEEILCRHPRWLLAYAGPWNGASANGVR